MTCSPVPFQFFGPDTFMKIRMPIRPIPKILPKLRLVDFLYFLGNRNQRQTNLGPQLVAAFDFPGDFFTVSHLAWLPRSLPASYSQRPRLNVLRMGNLIDSTSIWLPCSRMSLK